MKKNDIFEIEITDFTTAGEGIGKVDAFPLFVKDTVPGDRVRVRVTKLLKNYGYGRLLEILQPSGDRVPARCPEARRCGGCQIQEMSYEAQLLWKRNLVESNLRRIGGFQLSVPPVLGMADPWHYRNKAQIPVGEDRSGNLVSGFYAGRTHDIIPSDDCLLAFREAAEAVRILKDHMKTYRIPAYREESGSGLVRHLLVRKAFASGELMITIVVNGQKLPHAEALTERFLDIPGFRTLTLSINTERTNVILGRESKTLCGPGFITDTIGGIRFRISPNSFYQVNPSQTEVLYRTALEFAGLTGRETVWDLYCGIGTISLFLAQSAGKVYGVEVVPQAVSDAHENAFLNGFRNTEFFTGKAEEVLPAWHEAHPDESVDVITVDPPRKGCDIKCLETILRISPSRIVYVSCNSATLARDLRILSDGGYEIRKIQPVDMFPHTCHIETVCLLSKLSEAKHHISVQVDMDELDLTSAESKATYEEIQEWVQEKYGFHVTHLNIAQVKRKHGIIERENYNKPKSTDSRQPGCSEEKIIAIEAALKHFQMI